MHVTVVILLKCIEVHPLVLVRITYNKHCFLLLVSQGGYKLLHIINEICRRSQQHLS